MDGRRASALCWTLTVLTVAAAGVFVALGPGRPLPVDLFGGVAGVAFLVLSLVYGTVGAVIVFRLPGHRIGWLFSLLGVITAVNGLTYAYAAYGLYAVDAPLARAAAVIWGTLQLTAPLLVLPLLLLPDGRLPSRRWWPVPAIALVAALVLSVSGELLPGREENPFGIVTN